MPKPSVITPAMADDSPHKLLNSVRVAGGIDTFPLPSQCLATSEGTGTSTTLYDGWPIHSPSLAPIEPRLSGERLFNSPDYRGVFDYEKRPESVNTTSRLSGLLPSWPISSSCGRLDGSSDNAVKWEVCSIDFSSSRPNTHAEPFNSSTIPSDITNVINHPIYRQLMGQSSSQHSGESESSRGSYQSSAADDGRDGRKNNYWRSDNGGSDHYSGGLAGDAGPGSSDWRSHSAASSGGTDVISSSSSGDHHENEPTAGFTDSDSDRTVSDVDDSAYLASDQVTCSAASPTHAFSATQAALPPLVHPVVRPFLPTLVHPAVEPILKSTFDQKAPGKRQRQHTRPPSVTSFVPASPESPVAARPTNSTGSDLLEPNSPNIELPPRKRGRPRSRSHLAGSVSDDTDSESESEGGDHEDQSYGPSSHKSTTPSRSSLHRWRDAGSKSVLRLPAQWVVQKDPSRPLNIPNMPKSGTCPRIVLSTRRQLQGMVKREASRRQSEILEHPDNGHLPDNLGIEPRLNRLQTRDLGRRYLRPLVRPKNAVQKAVLAQREWPRITRGSIKCSPHCDLTFTTWSGLARHLDTTLDYTHRPYLCQEPNCLWSMIGFPTLSECWRHTRAAHTVVKFDCELCELEGEIRTFTRSDALRRHYGRVHLKEE